MTKIVIYFLFICFPMTLFSMNTSTYKPQSSVVGEKAYQLNILASYWQTTSHYEIDGSETELAEGEDFTKIDGELELRYGFSPSVEARVGARFRQNSATADLNANDLTTSGLESAIAGIRVLLSKKGRLEFSLDGFARTTFYENTVGNTGQDIVLGDEGQEVGVGGALTFYRTPTNFFSAQLHYVTPGNDLSEELRWNTEIGLSGLHWTMTLGVDGINSLGNSDYDSVNTPPAQETTATRLFNSVDREIMAPYIGIYFAQRSWRIGFKHAQVMSGVSTDAGANTTLTFTWTSKGKSKEGEKISQFKEYNVEASVVKVSPRSSFLKIDKGIANDIEKGMKFDIYKTDYFGENILVASGFAYQVQSETAIIKLVKKYKRIKIENGFVARGY